MPKIRVAFIKYGGLQSAGTERWLQSVSAYLNKDAFEATYFYTGEKHSGREDFLLSHGVRLVHVAAEGKKSPYGEWLNTDLFEKFNESHFDIIQTVTAGPREWPYYLFRKPVLECIAYDDGVNFSLNVHHTFLLSHWLREYWITMGGSRRFSSVAVVGVEEPANVPDMRESLGIPKDAIVAGFHQRPDDNTYSTVPLNVFADLDQTKAWFLILGGSGLYSEQAARLGIKTFTQLPYTAARDAISSFLHTLDIFAHGRKDGETLGYVFVEALMHNLPCLAHAARSNAHKDTMGPGGLWAKNEDEYAQQLKRLFADADLRQRLAALGGSFARETYNNAKAMWHIEYIYNNIHKKSLFYAIALTNSTYIRNILIFLHILKAKIWHCKSIIVRKAIDLCKKFMQ